jgi:hypothetical protein
MNSLLLIEVSLTRFAYSVVGRVYVVTVPTVTGLVKVAQPSRRERHAAVAVQGEPTVNVQAPPGPNPTLAGSWLL